MKIEKMMKLKFEIAKPEQIAEWVFNEFKTAIISNPEGVAGQLIFINFSEELKQKIMMNVQLTDELKEKMIEEIKKKIPDNLEELKNKIAKKWEIDKDKIINEIESFTEQKFYQKEITCYINTVVCSSYLEKEKNIILGFKEVPKKIDKIHDFITLIIAEELLHVHYVTILHKMPELANKQFDQFKEWQVSEVLPEFILMENKNLSYLDKGPREISDRSGPYPWLNSVKEKIEPVWKNRKSFKDFIIKVYHDYNSC